MLRERVGAGLRYPAELELRGRWGGEMLVPGQRAGACRYLMARWAASARVRRAFYGDSVALLALLLAATAALSLWLALRPLRRRIEGLRELAVRLDASGVDAESRATLRGTRPVVRETSPAERGQDADAREGPAARATSPADAPAGAASALRDLGAIEAALERSIRRVDRYVEELDARRQAMEIFLADVAHDVKTPMASMHLSVDELAALPLPAEGEALVRRLSGDVVYLRNLFANLALAARLRDGPAGEAVVFDLRGVVERVGIRAGVLARRNAILLDSAVPGTPVWVCADETLAEQALTNLADNAVLHGLPGGRVAISLERRGSGFAVRVSDDGPGVPAESLPRLGERTFRSDEARRRDSRGSGLGLAIVTEACERAGWTLHLRALVPCGIEARIAGPLMSCETAPPTAQDGGKPTAVSAAETTKSAARKQRS
ncbi:sensor histidine kinase [Haliangium ochraceum]|uniref:sensor histidine kinase n=1 Tax=Haliangium ochraceum TaxID=80816 RepID=UPI0018EF9F12|nr:HAMP domain-containing sensor histidine kinase [Haliangium ochraceum]